MLSEGSTFVPITDHSFSCREGGDHMLAFSNNTGEPVGRGKTPPPNPHPLLSIVLVSPLSFQMKMCHFAAGASNGLSRETLARQPQGSEEGGGANLLK